MKLVRSLLAVSLAVAAGGALAQAYPNRAVTLGVPFAAGGPTDVVARSLGQAMSRSLGAKLTTEGLRTWLQAETDRYGPMIRKAGAYAD